MGQQGFVDAPLTSQQQAAFTDAPLPTFSAPNAKDAQGNALVDGASHAWHAVTTPLIPQISQAAHAIADYMAKPRLGDAELNEHFPGLGTLAATLRGGGAGMVEGAGDLAASFTSVAGIAMTLAGLGPESTLVKRIPALKSLIDLPQVKSLQKAVQAVGGAAFAGHGASQVATGDTLQEKALGAAEMASGVVGATSALRTGTPGATPVPRLTAEEAASNAFATERGIPLDPATATGSGALRAVQKRVAHTLGGEPSALRLMSDQQQGLQRVGAELADRARPAAVTPEQIGTTARTSLETKATGHLRAADTAYDEVRALEEHPSNRIQVPLPPEAVDKLPDHLRGQLRRIVHEMDAMPYTKRLLQPAAKGGSLEHVPGTGGAGAAVFDDIVARLDGTSTPTRGAVQQQLEEYLGGGKEGPYVTAALEVAKERNMARGGNTVAKPELPPSAQSVPTRLEGDRVTTQEMGLPVYQGPVKDALRPIFNQMMRQMPEAQAKANPGLKAIGNILDGPDWAPLSQADTDLSAIKALARERGGLAKLAVTKFEAAIQEAVADTPAAKAALDRGRAATIQKVETERMLEKLPGGPMEEPTAVFKRATANDDAGLGFLRKIKAQTPAIVPQMARAKLDDMLSLATERGRFDHADKVYADWQKLGPETKRILFPDVQHRLDLDRFFLLAKRFAENPNPSGTAHVSKALDLVYSLGTYPLAKVLYTPRGVRAITRLLTVVPKAATATTLRSAAQTAGWIEVVTAARAAGVPMDLPRAADASPDTRPRP